MKRTYPVLILLGLASVGLAQNIPFDPGTGLTHFTSNSNDGYSGGRGVWFQANANIVVQGAGFYNGFNQRDSFDMTLYTATSDGSDLHVTTLGTFNVNPAAFDGYQDGLFGSNINLTAGNYYALEVFSNASFAKNYFYNWNGPGVNLGPVTILDGYLGNGGLGNTVAPGLRLNVVPEPLSMLALGSGIVAMAARRRRK